MEQGKMPRMSGFTGLYRSGDLPRLAEGNRICCMRVRNRSIIELTVLYEWSDRITCREYKLLPVKSRIIIGCIIMFVAVAYGGVGESAVITLSFPFGARSAGMGEVGTALADDQSVLFFNPAGLGVADNAWMNGAASWSFEYLLPAFIDPEIASE